MSFLAPAPAPTGAGGFMGGCSGFTAASTIISAALGIFMGTRSRGVKPDVFSNVDVVKTKPRAEFFALETDELKSYVDRIGDFGTVTVIIKDTTAPAPPSPSPSSSAFATTLLAALLSGLSSLLATFFSSLSSLSPLLASMAYDFAFNLLVWQTVSWGLYFLVKFFLWAHRTTRHLITIFRAIPALLALLKSLPSERAAHKADLALIVQITTAYSTFLESALNDFLSGLEALGSEVKTIKEGLCQQRRVLGLVLASLLEANVSRYQLVAHLRAYATHNQEAMNAFQRTVASLQSDDVEGHLAAVLVAVQDELKHSSLQLSRANAGSRTTFTPSSAAPNTEFGPQNGSLFRGFWAGGSGYNSFQGLNKASGA